MVTSRRAKSRPRFALIDDREKKQETIRFINACLDKHPVDVQSLREVAISRGFVNNSLRSKVWPLLLGCAHGRNEEAYEIWKRGEHRDSSVVDADLQRSLWAYTKGWTEVERAAKRRELGNILTAVVCQHEDDVFYYQGLHDVASVLLFVTGERIAFTLLSALTTCHLRDCTRPTLDAVLESLHLLPTLIQQCDKEVYAFIEGSGIPPFFALSWLITWFSHNLQDLLQISRIFDILLASHPLMPLYCSAIIIKACRKSILGAEDPSELHRALTNLPIIGAISADDIAKEANQLKKRCPPERLVALSGLRLQRSTAAEAELIDGRWTLPDKKVSYIGLVPRIRVLDWFHDMCAPEQRKSLMRATYKRRFRIMGGLVAVLVSTGALLASHTWH